MFAGIRGALVAGVVAVSAVLAGAPAAQSADVQQVGRDAYL
jgi:hypothetical protein